MTRERLIEAVNLLTRQTPMWVDRERADGSKFKEVQIQEPLLAQLRSALRPGMEHGSGGAGGGGSRAAVAINALDLVTRIESDIIYHYWLVKTATRRPGGYTFEDRLQYWAAAVEHNELKAKECEKILTGWVSEIQLLLSPRRRIELQGACPGCNQSHYLAEEDGEQIRKPTLTATASEHGASAACGNCGKEWKGFELHELAEHVTRPSEAVSC